MVGRTVQQYQLGEKLGGGGMGEVYKALDTRLSRFVAIKVLAADISADSEYRRRFIQEARAASALNHPNIITIYDVVYDGDTQYMVMEYVAGKTLLELIPQGGLGVPETIRYASQMADALCTAHAAGIIHRDLKPANVMINGNGLVKLLDFGLAKLMAWAGGEHTGNTATMMDSPLTIGGTIMGTVNYMSPEQAEGRNPDARSDVFSFGAVLYEMLTGQRAFRGESALSTLSAVLRDDTRPMVELTTGVPPELEQIVLRCLKKDPEQRFQSMREAGAALTALHQLPRSGNPDSSPTVRTIAPAPQPATRSVWKALAAGIALAGVAAAGWGLWWTIGRPPAKTQAPVVVPAERRQARAADGVLTNDDILEMAGAKVAPSVIVSQIRASKTNFNLSAGEVIRLSKGGVTSGVIEAMRNPAAEYPPPATPTAVIVGDGLMVRLVLAQDVPSNASPGDEVQFKAAHSLRVDGTTVVPEGAAASGTIADAARKRILGLGGKMTVSLQKVGALDGQRLAIRATPARGRDGSSKHPLSSSKGTPKEVAAAVGTEFTGYIDGPQTVLVKK